MYGENPRPARLPAIPADGSTPQKGEIVLALNYTDSGLSERAGTSRVLDADFGYVPSADTGSVLAPADSDGIQ